MQFKIKSGDVEYGVYWSHDKEVKTVGDKKETIYLGKSYCRIVKLGENPAEVASGKSQKHAKDNFCKATARKLTFSRALNNLWGGKSEVAKKERRLWWDAYLSVFNKPKSK